jgi:hypothetical protein
MFPCEMARYIAGFQPEARKYGRVFGPPALRFKAVRGQIQRSGPLTISIGRPADSPWPAPDALLAAVPRSEAAGAAARPSGAEAAGAPPCAAVGPVRPSEAAEQPSAGVVAEARPCGVAVGPPSEVAAMELRSWAEAEPLLAEVAPEQPVPPAAEAAPHAPPTVAGLAACRAAVEAVAQAPQPAAMARRRWVAACREVADRAVPLRQRPVSQDRRQARAAFRAWAARSD